jgi:hypothetical protein
MDIDSEGTETAITVFDHSLAWLRRRLPRASITIVYIPSPLTIYHRLGPGVDYDYSKFTRGHAAEQVIPRSKQVCELVRAASARAHVGFADTGAALRQAASIEPIHGPLDWVHFNAQGYRALGKFLALRLSQPAVVDQCG